MVVRDRNKKILDELISNPSITSTALEKKYDLTRRQLGYSFNKINDWLMTKDLPLIERTRKGQFIIDQAVFLKLSNGHENIALDSTIITEEQRVHMIIMMLLSSAEELSLNHFTIELEVSKNTILNDMKQAQILLDAYELCIRYSRKYGYVVEGNEFQARKLLIYVTQQILQMRNGKCRIKELTGIKSKLLDEFNIRIERVENKLNLKFTDEKLETMPYILILILRRIEKGNKINAFAIKYEKLSDTKEYQATEEILYDFKEIPVTERLFITLHLLTTNVYWSEYLTEEAIPNLVPAIDNMVRLFEKSACIYLKERDQLLDRLLQHIQPAYYRIKYHLNDTINFHGSLSKEFKELHHLVKRSIGPLTDLIGADIPESEIAYITMLIGGWMNRQGESIERKIKAVVVCPQGVSVSKLMFNELKELFPEFIFLDSLSVREFQNYKLDYDIVFSSVPLETDKKVFISKVFLGQDEGYRLRKQVMLEIHGYIPNDINVNRVIDIIKSHSVIKSERDLKEDLEQYFNRDDNSVLVRRNVTRRNIDLDELILPENITLKDSVDSWEEAIKIASEPLLNNGSITENYVEAMINDNSDPYIVISPNIAIPHAAPENGVNKLSMSLLLLKNGVKFSEDHSINAVVVVAAVDKEQHIRALTQLVKLVANSERRNLFIHSQSIKEVLKLLNMSIPNKT